MLKKTIVIPVVAFLLGGLVVGLFVHQTPNQSDSSSQPEPLYWVAPMDANYRKDGPGKSPMGMDLVPVYEEAQSEQDPAGTVTISSQIESELGVRTAQVESRAIRKDLNVAGFIQYDDSSLQHYHSRTSGWVETLYVFSVGDQVKKGDKLYDLYSPELVYAQQEFISALNTTNQLLLESSRLKLQALGVNSQQTRQLEKDKKIRQKLTFYAQKTGYLSHLNVREGMYIQPQVEILATANLARIWVMAEVFESQSSWLAPGLPVTMEVKALAQKQWQGKIDYIFPNVNAENRTQQVRVVFENPQLELKPNMFAQLSIRTKPAAEQLTVPSDAVIITGTGERVVLALGEGKFRSVKVTTGLQGQGRTQILSGLESGQSVVTSAQFLIDSESNIAAELNRIDPTALVTNEESIDRVWVNGKIIQVEEQSLMLSHEPVEKWQWPAMQMSLAVDETIDLSDYQSGDEIGFCLDEFENKTYRITHIEKVEPVHSAASSTMNHEGMNHEEMDHTGMNHEQMKHDDMDHSQMNHETMDHSGHQMESGHD